MAKTQAKKTKKKFARKTTYATVFAKRLRIGRERKGWSQAELGAEIGTSLQRVSDYECGRKSPGLKMLGRIGEALHLSLDWMLGIH